MWSFILRKKLPLLFLFFSAGCAGINTIQLRSELIRPYRYSDQAKEGYQAPYLSIYEKGRKTLVYVAADHGSEIDGPTFKTIRFAFEKYSPQVTLIEGVEYEGTDSPDAFRSKALACADHAFRSCSESAFTAYLSAQHQIPFIPAEISEADARQKFIDAGYPKDEYDFLTAGQLVTQYKRQQKEKLLDLNKHLKREAGVSYDKFKEWFQLKSGTAFSLDQIDSETFSPQTDKNPSYFNQLAALDGMVRETFILERIKEATQRFDRILIVYGSGHLVKEREVLQDAFGTPKDLKPHR